MTKLQDILFFKVFKPYGSTITILFLVIMLIIISSFLFYNFVLPLIDKKRLDNTSNANLRDSNLEVKFFYVSWCPACIKAKPEWSKFVDKYNNKRMNEFKVKCIEIDCTNDKDPLIIDAMSSYNIKHFPTVKIVKDKEIIDYEGKVTVSNLEQFIKSFS
jgi:thiol-disulfide isomerase/thioredoxin